MKSKNPETERSVTDATIENMVSGIPRTKKIKKLILAQLRRLPIM
jgi:hypothetical protein